MFKKVLISPIQLFALIVLFEFGTAIVVPIGLQAQQGAWLAILFALPAGLLLYLMYDHMMRLFPGLIFSGYLRVALGRYAGGALSLIYACYFMYVASRNLREAGDLLTTSAYDQTPALVIHGAMTIAVIYTLYKGLEVLARLSELYMMIIFSLVIIAIGVTVISGVPDYRNLLPIFDGGAMRILRTAYPNILSFPFAELICLTAILPHVTARKSFRLTGIAAVLISAVILSVTHALEVAVLGPGVYSRSTFPLLSAISIVRVGEFLQRMDAIVILTLIICVFFKMTIYCYVAAAMIADSFNLATPGRLAYPIGMIVLVMSIMSAWSRPEHFQEGIADVQIYKPVLNVGMPILLIGIAYMRKSRRKRQADDRGQEVAAD